MTNNTLRIVLTGGGTAGHLFPTIAVARKIREKRPDAEIYFIGPKTVGAEVLLQEGIVYKKIFAGKLRRYFASANFVDLLFRLPLGFLQSLWFLFKIMPDAVFCKGGFGSLPATLAAWIYRIPIIVHESDSVPGLSNRIVGRLAKKIAVSFPEAKQYFKEQKTALIGNPMRETLEGGTLEEAKKAFRLQGDRPLIFITGGSQGAEAINTIIMAILPKLLEQTEIIHQCGLANQESIKIQLPQTIPSDSVLNDYYHYSGFLNTEQMKQAYAAADLVLARAGANTINELANLGKPAILIPLPDSAGDHQTKNAFSYAKYGGAVIFQQPNLAPNILAEKIINLSKDREILQKMSAGAKNFAYPDADEKLAEALLELARG